MLKFKKVTLFNEYKNEYKKKHCSSIGGLFGPVKL